MRATARRLGGTLGQVLVFLTFFAAWEAAVHVFGFKEVILPAPSATFVTMWAKRAYLLQHTWPTVIAILVGFLLASVAGFIIAIGIAYSRWINELTYPFLVAAQVVPKIALAPLFLIWFGVGLLPKVVIAALIAFFPVVINTAKGLTSVEPELVQFMRSLGASWHEIFFKISLPWALPYIFAAFKISMTLAVVGAVVGEFIASDAGLGYVVNYANITLETRVMFAGLLLLSLVGIALFLLVVMVERYVLSWQPSVEAATPETL
ncbi:MAG TPA: ABC transporter permease [Methylomirabilota bacterium]|nr:ABC transporter permease [Methylomirabilota bacterium]